MKKVDSEEFHNINQYNDFSEYQPFPAEQYYTREAQSSPAESSSYNETYGNQGDSSSQRSADSNGDFDKAKKEYDKLNSSDSSESSSLSTDSASAETSSAATSSSSASSQAASTASGASAQAGSVAGGAVAGAGATAAVAVVIVSAAMGGGFIANFNNYVDNNVGTDYVSITVDMDEVLSQSDKTYSLSADNFYLEFAQGASPIKIALVEGKHSYLVTGLLPEKTYSYSILCNNASIGSKSSCYTGSVTTKSVGEPECVLDEFNNYITYDEASQTASLYYSVYLSDCEKIFSNSTLYLCSSEQTDFSNINHVIYSDNELDENNFFKGSADGITYEELYLYVVGQPDSSAQAEARCLYSQRIEVGLPEEWAQAAAPAFAVDDTAEDLVYQPDSISVSGKLNKLNENFTYSAYVVQYSEDGTALVERQEVTLNINAETMTYSLECGAYYGVKSFEYVVYTNDGTNEIAVYESGTKQFTAEQTYLATYTQVQPADATIEYTAEKITITANTGYTSAYSNYSYKLVVTNSLGEVFGQYQGTGNAVIEITDFTGLDTINFTYYDLGEFAGGERQFAEHTTTGIEFNYIFIEVDESAEAITTQPDTIAVSGKLNKLNENFTYSAYVAQYSEDGTALVERQEVALNINAETMTYSLECGAYYGVKNYSYVIYTNDGTNEIAVYESGTKQFTAEQTYLATYTQVQPADATIEYTAEKITITADTGYTSAYSNYSYKLVVTNSLGEVYGQYQGTGNAVIEITDFTGLDIINFTYYDLGEFAGGEREYESHATTGIEFNYIFIAVDEGEEVLTTQPDTIAVSGKLNKLNENFTYSAYVEQYNEDGTALVERQEVTLNIDTEAMTYSLECGAYYGVKSFEYVIYTNDGTNEIAVYESGSKAFTAEQTYLATYTQVQPADATIEYTAEKITITANTGYTSAYSNYSYKLVVTNSLGEVYGQYQGTGNAVIEITDFTGLDIINFTYYDLGEFADGERQFAEHTTTGIEFNYIFIAVDEGEEVLTTQPDTIGVSGKLNKLNENFTYSAYVAQYSEDGTALVERQEVTLNIDTETMTYSLECGAYYGVKSFEYIVYTNDGTNEIAVYESGSKAFTAEQTYLATYTQVQPADATIEYTAAKITITANTGYTSAYSNYSYKLVVTNSLGEVYGQYQGTGNAVIEITDFTGLDTINFTYYDLGEFVGGERQFAEHTTTGIEFNYIFIAVDEGEEALTTQPDTIAVSGKLNKLNENFTYSAYVEQYSEDGTALVERQEVALNIDTETMTYSLECGAYYGVKSFEYVVYTNDGTNEIAVYESGTKQFTAEQTYLATYIQVQPADATIEYTAEKITITADTGYTSSYSNYSYKLVVTNSLGEVFGQYQGTGNVVIEITDFAGLDIINFTYYDLGEFADGEREYESHATTGIEFNYIFIEVDESAEALTTQPDTIAVSGKLNKLNENFTYSAYVAQYNEDGTALVERQEVTLNIDTETMTYSLECGAYYGVKNYSYVIYTNDGTNEIAVYESGSKAFTAEQTYLATYTQVQPADATIEYTAEKITITANTGYTSSYSNYSYKLVVTNSLGEVFGQYQGTGNAVIEITDFTGLDIINFTYYDLGEFAGGERQFAEHTTTGIEFNYIFIAVDEGEEVLTTQPDTITVSGKLNKLNENFTYSAYVAQYSEDGTALVERQEVTLNINAETMTYSFECGAYYGVKSFEYIVYTNDGTNEIAVYESGTKQFTAEQTYLATYTQVQPADATIEYTAEKITITADTGFTSAYSNYSYKLVVTNSLGEVYGQYQGTGNAVIEITDFTGLDTINFTYYDLGEFADGEREYESHATTGIEFNYIFIAVDEGEEVLTTQPDTISVSGKLNKLNENFTYSVYVVQYSEDGTALVERQEVTLNINAETMTYSLECGAYYGVKSFEYIIYTNDGTNEIAVYESASKAFTAEQTYLATYTQVQPADATIEYTAEKITITANTGYTSAYSNYSYKLVVTNSLGEVYGQYQGTGNAVIEITDFTGLDTINFTYYDLGEFVGGEREYESHATTGIEFNYIFIEVDESAEALTTQPDTISVSGKLNKLNENFTYSAYVAQYSEDGTALVERQEVTLNIDTETMTYSLECGAYYGVKNYSYVIYTNDGTNEIAVYESGSKAFTAEQTYLATYTQVQPADATIEYTAEKITITANTGYTSAYSNYSYKLVVTNSLGEVYGQYQGTGNAVIEITDFTGLDIINFTYYDLGEFAGGEREYESHATTGIEFNYIFIAVDEGEEVLTTQPDTISVSGALTKLNENFTYSAYVAQYSEDGTALVERQEVTLNIDTETMTYSLECGAYYGVKNYSYVIYTNDGTNEIAVYESGSKAFTAEQTYLATYTQVQPADATIEYTAEKITITANTGFTSEYSNYSYKLVVTNSLGEVYGQYQGTGNAVIEITDFTGLDIINFTYYDLGEFVGGERQFAEHTTTGIEFNYIFIEVDESAEVLTTQPDTIAVSGKLNKLNENFTYSAYIAQYSEDGTALVERQEVALNIDTETMTYSLECGAYYGVKNYSYVIYTNDGTNEIAVYESGSKAFTAEQTYLATYTQVQPADATIEYTAAKITITANTGYTSAYSNYSYKLVVTNSLGEVYGQYQGTGNAVIEITDFTGLDTINFTYYDLGEFVGGERQFAEHMTEGIAFCMPTLSFGAEYGFDGQYFTLSYTCGMDYDYAGASLDIEVSDGTNTYVKHVDSVSASGTIILDVAEGELGNVTIKGTLNFTDNQSDGVTHSLLLAQAEYAMNYSFEVASVTADVSGYAMETNMPVTLNFAYRLPDGYKIKITDEANSLSLTTGLTEQYSFSDLAIEAEANLTIQATDADGNNWGEAKTVNISKSAAQAEYVSPTMSCPNPGDAVVTYNDDGTINVYREMIPSAFGVDTVSTDERVYYNAFMHAGYYDESYNFIETYRFDVIGRGKYAAIENIPKENYIFIYYQMFDFNGVSYVMNAEMPSGMVETVYDCGTVTATVSGGQTVVTLSVSKYGKLANRIIVNGVEYEYDSYSDESATDLTLTIDGELAVSEATIFFTTQGYNYDAYGASGEITMKGSKYGEYTIAVTPVEA